MCFGISALNSLLNAKFLVVLNKSDYWDDSRLFEAVFNEILASASVASKIHWFRNNPPSKLPTHVYPSASFLSRIVLHYGHGRNIDQIVEFCANAPTTAIGRIFVVVELNRNDIPHNSSLGTVLALLTDLSKVLGDGKTDSLGISLDFPVVALISADDIFSCALIASLYTDCIAQLLPDGSFQNILCKCWS